MVSNLLIPAGLIELSARGVTAQSATHVRFGSKADIGAPGSTNSTLMTDEGGLAYQMRVAQRLLSALPSRPVSGPGEMHRLDRCK